MTRAKAESARRLTTYGTISLILQLIPALNIYMSVLSVTLTNDNTDISDSLGYTNKHTIIISYMRCSYK